MNKYFWLLPRCHVVILYQFLDVRCLPVTGNLSVSLSIGFYHFVILEKIYFDTNIKLFENHREWTIFTQFWTYLQHIYPHLRRLCRSVFIQIVFRTHYITLIVREQKLKPKIQRLLRKSEIIPSSRDDKRILCAWSRESDPSQNLV